MQKIKRFLFLGIGILFLDSCGPEKIIPKGAGAYGGVFRINEVEDFRSFFPLNVTDICSFNLTSQIYEGLVSFDDGHLAIIPSIAEKWEVSADATSFTFYLHKGVKFQDDPCFPEGKGREVTAKDFEYCFTRLCSAFPENQMFWLFKDKVKGAVEYYDSTVRGTPLSGGVSGIQVIDDYTLRIDLLYPFSGFLNILGHNGCWVYPREAFEKYGIELRVKAVGTGPFIVKNIMEGQGVVLERNPNYWRTDQFGNKLPFLDAVKVSFTKEKKLELLEFRKGNLDMIFELPLEMIGTIVDELEEAQRGKNPVYEMQITPALQTQYYGFLHKSDVFQNKKVRQAFNYAIDRDAIVRYTLQGEGTPAKYGLVPPGFIDYEYDSLQGFSFDPAKAKELLKEAGYPGGNGFPKLTLYLNSGGDNYTLIAQTIQKMLQENLEINIELEVLPKPQHLDNVESAKAMFFRTAWIADYPDPENFLMLMYGKNVPASLNERTYLNVMRYQSAAFDSLFEKALREKDRNARFRLFRQADQVAIDDAVIMPIYYPEYTRLLQKNVRNFKANGMEFRNLAEVYFDNSTKKK